MYIQLLRGGASSAAPSTPTEPVECNALTQSEFIGLMEAYGFSLSQNLLETTTGDLIVSNAGELLISQSGA